MFLRRRDVHEHDVQEQHEMHRAAQSFALSGNPCMSVLVTLSDTETSTVAVQSAY